MREFYNGRRLIYVDLKCYWAVYTRYFYDVVLWFFLIGWIDVNWDFGGFNFYRMGVEGKYDLVFVLGYDLEKYRVVLVKVDLGVKVKIGVVVLDKVKVSWIYF